jgi:hypothetical protein
MAAKQEIEFIDDKERELFAVATLGEDAREFLRSHPVGRYLHHRAKQMIQQAEIDALAVDTDAWPHFRGRNKLRQIRERAAVARAFINWLAEAILEGDAASQELEEYRK